MRYARMESFTAKGYGAVAGDFEGRLRGLLSDIAANELGVMSDGLDAGSFLVRFVDDPSFDAAADTVTGTILLEIEATGGPDAANDAHALLRRVFRGESLAAGGDGRSFVSEPVQWDA